MRWTGWTFIVLGALILLYVVYLLWWTNRETDVAQEELREQWEAVVVDPSPVPPPPGEPEPEPEPIEVGDAYAVMWFERPGEDASPINRDPIYLVHGVDLGVLRRGPGHYPESSPPGGDGNFAVAGHRTTYGAPFFYLDRLEAGDEIHVLDRQNRQWRYVVDEVRIVRPQDVWVVGRNPRGDGRPLLTLTTCHPRFSASQRLIVWATLDGEVTEAGEEGDDAAA